MSDCRKPKDTALVESLVGATITKAEWLDDCKGESWTGHEYARLTFTDGRVIEFGGFGFDSWCATVEDVTPRKQRAKDEADR